MENNQWLTIVVNEVEGTEFKEMKVEHSENVKPLSLTLNLLEREFARMIVLEDCDPVDLLTKFQEEILPIVMVHAMENIQRNIENLKSQECTCGDCE